MKNFMSLVLVFLVLGSSSLWAEEDCDSCKIKDSKKKVASLRKEINLLNLINGLNLTKDQIRQLLDMARTLKESGEALGILKTKTIPEELQKEKIRLLQKIRSSLLEGETIPVQLKRKFWKIERKTNLRVSREDQQEFLNQVRILEEKAQKILTPSQREVISTYKPCLIPPKNLKNPIRIGQAKKDTPFYGRLKSLRALPTWKYEFLEEALLSEFLDKYENHFGEYSRKERKQIFQKLCKIVRKARAMSDAQFEIQKDNLGKELNKILVKKKEVLAKELEELRKKKEKGYRPGKIARFLLNPKIIPIYQKRLKLLETQKLPSTDLAKIKGVKDCKECAVKKK